jgi:uncharacterized Fe-S cluster-containing radical SAM superfamily protein
VHKLNNPEIIAKQRRELMRNAKTKQYFVSDYSEAEMAKDASIIGNNFRIREYIKLRDADDYGQEWLSAPLSEMWSTKFLGLGENGFQKLEFQNPPYVASLKLGGDPRKYNNTFVIQLNGCDYECSFCFVDRSLNKTELGKGKYFTAKDMVDEFQKERSKHLGTREELNVIRLTGGEVACITPELIIDLCGELEKRNLSSNVYVWSDCNLSTSTYLEGVLDKLRHVIKSFNFGIVGCLKAIGDGKSGSQDFAETTNAQPEFFSKQFEALDFLINKLRADTYVYLVPIFLGKPVELKERMRECCSRLRQIHKNLPLRVNVLQIRNYSPVKENMLNAFKEGRKLPVYNGERFEDWLPKFVEMQRNITKIWFENVLPSFYSTSEIRRYRCQVPI